MSEPDLNQAAEQLSHEIARYVARYDCRNVDLSVDPIDLLRQVEGLVKFYDDECDRLDQQIEKLQAGETEEIVKLKLRIAELEKLEATLAKAPAIRELLERAG